MASRLRTSRGPLREALQRLCREGPLVNHRNRGVFVLDLADEDIKEIYAVREAMESAAANTLLDGRQEQITDNCDVLHGIIKDMAKQVAVSDWQAIARLDMQFHTFFVAGTGISRLIRIYETPAAESRMCILSLEVSYPRVDVLVQEHQNTSWICACPSLEDPDFIASNCQQSTIDWHGSFSSGGCPDDGPSFRSQ